MVSGESILYTYTSTGQKLSQELETADGGAGVLRQYAGPFVYINNEMAWINTAEGRITNPNFGQLPVSSPSFKAEFHLRDHLGNTRLVMEDVNGFFYYNIQQADYYPFGMQQHRAYMTPKTATSTNLLTNRYLYNGKEMQDDMELGWYDYGARFYDAQVARFHNVDPLGEVYSFQSGYAYAVNNPVRFIDYMGMGPSLWDRIRGFITNSTPSQGIPFADSSTQAQSREAIRQHYTLENFYTLQQHAMQNDPERSGRGRAANGGGFVGGDTWNSTSNHLNGAGFTAAGAEYSGSRALSRAMKYYSPSVSTIKPNQVMFKVPGGSVYASTKFVSNATKVLKVGGAATGVLGVGMTGYEIYTGQKSLMGEGGLDLIMGGVAFIPGGGWIVSGAYFGGKYLLEATGNDFWNEP